MPLIQYKTFLAQNQSYASLKKYDFNEDLKVLKSEQERMWDDSVFHMFNICSTFHGRTISAGDTKYARYRRRRVWGAPPRSLFSAEMETQWTKFENQIGNYSGQCRLLVGVRPDAWS